MNKVEKSMWLKNAFQSSPIGHAFFEENGEILFANSALKEILGLNDEVLPSNIYDILQLPPVDAEKVNALKLTPNNEFSGEYRITHNSNHNLWIKMHISYLQGNEDVPSCFVAHVLDITSRKNAERELEKSEKLTLAGRLATGIAHEVRNPLTSIKGFIQLIKNEGIDKNGYLTVVWDEINRIEAILSELLMIGKPREMRFEWNDFRTILENVTTLITSQGNLCNVEVKTIFKSPLPPIYCDGIQMKQVFINFLKNSIEAMPDGGVIQVNAGVEGDCLVVAIKDQGGGIPPEQQEKLGQPFFTTKENGTGLGLSICYQIIHNHKGRIKILNEDLGTTVRVYLPIKKIVESSP